MSQSGLPFDDIRTLCAMLPPPDAEAMAAARAHNLVLAKPVGALGRLEECAVWMAGWQGTARPAITRPLLATFAASHGVAATMRPAGQGDVSEEVALLAAGGAAANQLCAVADVGLKVFELALQVPTRDITTAAALDERECAATIAFGMEAIAGGIDLICLGAVGSDTQIPAAALLTALLGGGPEDWFEADAASAAPLAGPDRVRAALACHAGKLGDPLEALRCVGGRDFAAIMGAILAARIQRIPVVLSGVVSLAAASVLFRLGGEGALDHCIAGHAMPGRVHARLLAALNLTPLLGTEIALEDGAGAALAVPHLRAAVASHVEMATRPAGGLLN